LENTGYDPLPKKPLIELNIDSLEAFDYENADKAKFTVQDLKGMLIDEIMYYRQKNDKG
jgi:hypothetical protein